MLILLNISPSYNVEVINQESNRPIDQVASVAVLLFLLLSHIYWKEQFCSIQPLISSMKLFIAFTILLIILNGASTETTTVCNNGGTLTVERNKTVCQCPSLFRGQYCEDYACGTIFHVLFLQCDNVSNMSC